VAFPDESLRVVVYRMAETGLSRLPVVAPGAEPKLLGLVSLSDLLKARVLSLDHERRRERVLRLKPPVARRESDGQPLVTPESGAQS
jgi:CBS domain-containing protein